MGAHKAKATGGGQGVDMGRNASRGRIYVLDSDGKPKALSVRVGVSDGSMTELLPGRAEPPEWKEGSEVIVGTLPGAGGGSMPKPGGPRPPF